MDDSECFKWIDRESGSTVICLGNPRDTIDLGYEARRCGRSVIEVEAVLWKYILKFKPISKRIFNDSMYLVPRPKWARCKRAAQNGLPTSIGDGQRPIGLEKIEQTIERTEWPAVLCQCHVYPSDRAGIYDSYKRCKIAGHPVGGASPGHTGKVDEPSIVDKFTRKNRSSRIPCLQRKLRRRRIQHAADRTRGCGEIDRRAGECACRLSDWRDCRRQRGEIRDEERLRSFGKGTC